MSLAITNTLDNHHRGLGNNHTFGSGSFMSCHDPYPTMQPWGPVSAGIGHFGVASPMPQSFPVNPGSGYTYPRSGGVSSSAIGSGPQPGLLPLPNPSYPPPTISPPQPPAGPVTEPSGHGFAGGDYAVRDTAQDTTPTDGNLVDAARKQQPPPLLPPPDLAPVASSINPSNLFADRSNQARSVIVQIDGDVGRVLASKKGDTKPPKPTTPTKSYGISIAEGHMPATGFSIDYFGLDERFKSGWAGRSSAPGGATMPFKPPPPKVGWGEDGEKDPIFRCEICGLKWRGVVSTTLRGRNPAPWDDDQPAENPTLKRARIEEFYFYLADEAGDPCIKGITVFGNPHPSYRPMPASDHGLRKGVVEQDCCPPLCNRRLPPQIIDCVFDNCHFVNRSHAELRKHLLKKHAEYIKGLITRCEEERPMDDCDRAVCHFLMRNFAGLDAAGKRKISDPKRTVLLPDEMSNPAAYEEHCEWITYVAPRQEAPIIEFRTDEDGQAWQLTYTMDPGSRGPKMERIDPVTRMPLPGGGKKRRRIR